METDGRRMCEVLVGLGEVDLVGVEELSGDRLRVTIRSRGPRPVCEACGGRVWSKGDRLVRLVDLPAFGRPVRLRWQKRRWMCPNPTCAVGSSCGTGPVCGAGTGLVDVSRWAVGHSAGRASGSHGVGGGRRVGV